MEDIVFPVGNAAEESLPAEQQGTVLDFLAGRRRGFCAGRNGLPVSYIYGAPAVWNLERKGRQALSSRSL